MENNYFFLIFYCTGSGGFDDIKHHQYFAYVYVSHHFLFRESDFDIYRQFLTVASTGIMFTTRSTKCLDLDWMQTMKKLFLHFNSNTIQLKHSPNRKPLEKRSFVMVKWSWVFCTKFKIFCNRIDDRFHFDFSAGFDFVAEHLSGETAVDVMAERLGQIIEPNRATYDALYQLEREPKAEVYDKADDTVLFIPKSRVQSSLLRWNSSIDS